MSAMVDEKMCVVLRNDAINYNTFYSSDASTKHSSSH